MRKVLSAFVLLTGCSKQAVAEVPLQQIYANPSAFEGKYLRTCGRAPVQGPLLLVQGLNFGRSPAAIRLDQAVESKTGCLEAKIVRAPSVTNDPLLMDGPMLLEGWQLKVRRVF